MEENRSYDLREISSQYFTVLMDTCGFLADRYKVTSDLKAHRDFVSPALEFFSNFIQKPEGNNIFTLEDVCTELSKRHFLSKETKGDFSNMDSSEARYLNARNNLLFALKKRNKIVSKEKNPKFDYFSNRYSSLKHKFNLSPVDYSLLISSLVSSQEAPTAGISNDGHLLEAFSSIFLDLHLNKKQFYFFSHDSVGVFNPAFL